MWIFILTLIFVSTKDKKYIEPSNTPSVSILIPFKNEKHNLQNILNDLTKQNYPNNKLEIIFINDNSNDNGEAIINNFAQDHKQIKHYNLKQQKGKKQALKKGLEYAIGEIIIHTDADVRLNKNWVNSYIQLFNNSDTKLAFGAVIFTAEKYIFEKLQSLEILSLTGVTASTGIIGSPVLMSGANFAYRKELKQDFIDSINSITSGDDMFFLELIKKRYSTSIRYIKSKENIVKTYPEKTLKSFLNQRIRWAKKTPKFKDVEIVLSGIISFIANIAIIGLLIQAIFSQTILFNKYFIFEIALGIKFTIEFISLFIYAKYFNKIKIMFLFPILFIIYPFYISFVPIYSLFHKVKWK